MDMDLAFDDLGLRKEDIILHLIHQELKFAQLKEGMKRVGFESHVLNISLLEVIVAMMVSPHGSGKKYMEAMEGLGDLYHDHLLEAANYPVSMLGDELKPLAEKTYHSIRAYLQVV